MHILTQLDQLRLAFPDCMALAYADLGAGMILVKSAEIDVPQERWDQLCDDGTALLAGDPAAAARTAMVRGSDSAHAIVHAVVLKADELAVFLRSGVHPDDVILCVARPALPVADFIRGAGAVLDGMAGDD